MAAQASPLANARLLRPAATARFARLWRRRLRRASRLLRPAAYCCGGRQAASGSLPPPLTCATQQLDVLQRASSPHSPRPRPRGRGSAGFLIGIDKADGVCYNKGAGYTEGYICRKSVSTLSGALFVYLRGNTTARCRPLPLGAMHLAGLFRPTQNLFLLCYCARLFE